MDRAILHNGDVAAIEAWRDRNKDLVRTNPCPLRAIQIDMVDVRMMLRCIREKPGLLKIYLGKDGITHGYALLQLTADGKWKEVKNSFKRTPEPYNEAIQGAITIYCSLMALMVYGSDIEPHEPEEKELPEKNTGKLSKKRAAKKSGNGITYIVHRTAKGVTVGRKGSHASPNGIFTVRGHWRHYQNGNVIWISEYKKGTGEKKRKRYKVGNLPKEE